MIKTPLFIRFLNGESSTQDVISSITKSPDTKTRETAVKALMNPVDIDEFKKELREAVSDLIREGPGPEFASFVNNYMGSLEEDITLKDTPRGESKSQMARIKDEEGPWIQGFLCYNLSLYIKAFGLESLKKCKVCHKFFDHKGKWAVYCSDPCKKKSTFMKESDVQNNPT